MPQKLLKFAMWLFWTLCVYSYGVSAFFLTSERSSADALHSPTLAILLPAVAAPLLICGGLRYWLTRIRNSWIALILFAAGMSFAMICGFIGIFLVPRFYVPFQILSGVLFGVFLPAFVAQRTPSDHHGTSMA